MELLPGDYILGYWFLGKQNDDCWYAMVIKRNNEWEGQIIFRTNKSSPIDDPFAGKDEKNIYDITAPSEEPEEKIIETFDLIWEKIKFFYPAIQDKWLVQGDIKKFMQIAKTKHYMHFKETKLND